MKTLGIIGGMGPKATAMLYNRIVDHTKASCDQEHIKTIILSDTSIPDRTAAIKEKNTAPVTEALVNAARQLEADGASVIILPCNTSHLFIEEIRGAVSCKVINMAEVAVRDAIATNESDDIVIGIMSTEGTRSCGLYENEIKRQGAAFVPLTDESQAKVTSLIYEDIKAGKEGDKTKFEFAYKELKQRCDVVILACTELSVYAEKNSIPINCIDAMDSLVREAIGACEAEYKE